MALDEAIAEIESGPRAPSAQWKVRFGLMLGLERVPRRAGAAHESGNGAPPPSGGRARGDAHRADRRQRSAEEEKENGNGNGHAARRGRGGGRRGRHPRRGRRRGAPEELTAGAGPGAIRRYRFRHPTASGKTIAAAGFVEAARTLGVLILTHRRLLVSQFDGDLTTEGYRDRFTEAVDRGKEAGKPNPLTIQTYAWFARHVDELSRDAYQLVICDEAHTALGEKTSAAIRSFPEPVYIGMTATEQLIAKQVSDVFPASVDDLPLQDAARRGLIAPLRDLRVPPVAAINSVPIVGGDFDQEILAKTLDHQALNQAAASLYRDRFDNTPGIVYAAGVDHAYNLAQEFRAAGLKAEAVSGRTPPVRLAETLAAYERGEINVLINAQLLAEGWNSPRATVCMHLAPTASRRVYQQRIGRIMRLHPRKEAGIVVDFVPKGATHNERVISLHSLLDADFYREGARVTPAPRRRSQRRRTPPADAGTVARPCDAGRPPSCRRHPARVAARRPALSRRRRAALLGDDRRPPDPLRRARVVRAEADGRTREQGGAGDVPLDGRRREPEPAAATDGVARPGLDACRSRRFRRPRHARGARHRPGRKNVSRAFASCSARSQTESPTRRSRSLPAGRGASRARPARCRIVAHRANIRRRSACSARSRTRAATAMRRMRRGSHRPRSSNRCRSARHSSRPPRATRRARRRCSTRRASSSAPSTRSRSRSPRICRLRSSRRAHAAAAGGGEGPRR